MHNVRQLLDGSALAAMLNHRQIALLISMRKHPDLVYTIASHRRSHRVTYQTARTDLLGLAALGLVTVAQARQSIHLQPRQRFDRAAARAVGTRNRFAPALSTGRTPARFSRRRRSRVSRRPRDGRDTRRVRAPGYAPGRRRAHRVGRGQDERAHAGELTRADDAARSSGAKRAAERGRHDELVSFPFADVSFGVRRTARRRTMMSELVSRVGA